jgi:Prenyltransferase and squalene oxidase repeat
MQTALEACCDLKAVLVSRQLPSGGWPFKQCSVQAALEPTCLAMLALSSDESPARDRAIRFLLGTQNPNGSWPAFVSDDPEGSGLSGLALFALDRCGIKGEAADRGFRWLLNLRGWESHWLWRWKFKTSDRHVRFDPDKFGWPWMPETASWVVPTAYSLLALKNSFETSPLDLPRFRIRRGVEMLYDRICPQGGWNAGNGVVYGQPLAPHLDTTAIALLALRDEPTNAPVTASLDWLQQRAKTCVVPWSLAWAILALDAYGRLTYPLLARLAGTSDPGEIKDKATLAVVSMALDCALERNIFKVAT